MLGISEHDRRPKEVIERERKNKFDEEQQARLEYYAMLTGSEPKQKLWHKTVQPTDKLLQMGNGAQHPMFKREQYIEPLAIVARQMRDDVVFGKPIFHLYAKPLKSNDLNLEMGGIKKPFKVLN